MENLVEDIVLQVLYSRNNVDKVDKYMYPVDKSEGAPIIAREEPFNEWNIDYYDSGVVRLKAHNLCLTHPISTEDKLVLQNCELGNSTQNFYATPYKDDAVQPICLNQYTFKTSDGKYVGYGDNGMGDILKTQDGNNTQSRWCLSNLYHNKYHTITFNL